MRLVGGTGALVAALQARLDPAIVRTGQNVRRLRCDDTLGYDKYWKELSFRQLRKDVFNFIEEFPGVLAQDIVDEWTTSADSRSTNSRSAFPKRFSTTAR